MKKPTMPTTTTAPAMEELLRESKALDMSAGGGRFCPKPGQEVSEWIKGRKEGVLAAWGGSGVAMKGESLATFSLAMGFFPVAAVGMNGKELGEEYAKLEKASGIRLFSRTLAQRMRDTASRYGCRWEKLAAKTAEQKTLLEENGYVGFRTAEIGEERVILTRVEGPTAPPAMEDK